jgi:transcription initiation factor IIF auxiliary subunit
MKTLNKKLKIVTKVELTKKVIDSGHKIRKWKMWLESMEMKDGCLDFIQSVTYFLHPSFENPERGKLFYTIYYSRSSFFTSYY